MSPTPTDKVDHSVEIHSYYEYRERDSIKDENLISPQFSLV